MVAGGRTKKVRLVVSDRMDNGGEKEGGLIRVPKRARKHFATKGDSLVLRTKKGTSVLYIKEAYKADVQELLGKLRTGRISEEEVKTTGFITSETWELLYGGGSGRPHCYLTDSIGEIMLGADPEFALVDPKTKRYKYAQHVPGLSIHDELGHDGPLAEIRPPPDVTVAGVIENFRTIFERDQKKIDYYDWVGGAAYKCPDDLPKERVPHIGGHLQFGNPVALPLDQVNSIYRQTVRVLDETIGIPMVRIDCPFPHLRRNEKWGNYGRYGRYGDFRAKENRFEWRVLSGLWLTHPDIAQAVMGASKAVVESCYQMMSDNKFDADWICAPASKKGFFRSWGILNSATVEKVINDAAPKGATIELINRAAKKLRELENYGKYQPEIEAFIRIVNLSVKDRANLNLDLKDSWLGEGKLITGVKRV